MRGFLKKNEGILWVRKHGNVGGAKRKRWKDWDSMSIFLFWSSQGFHFHSWVWVAHNYFSPVVLLLCDLVSLLSYPAFFPSKM